MFCQNCHQRESTIHLTKIVNGQTTQIHLCQECAQKVQGFGFSLYPGMVSDFLQAIFGMHTFEQSGQTEGKLQQEKCPGCGRTFSQIQRAGRLGCSKCYEKFGPQMELLLRRIQGAGTHVGKVPARGGAVFRSKQELIQLREKLQELIQREEFEQAALVRDQIREHDKIAGGEDK
ncbi:MAG: Protein-arginine kinase activator protein [Candidatus Dichloromethanomonas elyunquensis]|nr:MAG: Protein-arginine kinase activator protein [Candidatus Dichloromethanomonas elyunquensis]